MEMAHGTVEEENGVFHFQFDKGSVEPAVVWWGENVFGGLSTASDFADLLQPGDYSVSPQGHFLARPVAR